MEWGTFFEPDFLSAMFGWILLNALGSFTTLPKNHEVLINTRTRQFRSLSENPFKRRETVLVVNHILLCKFVKKHTGKQWKKTAVQSIENDDDCGSLTPSEWMTGTEWQFCQRKTLHITFIILPKPAHQKKSKRNSKCGLAKRIFHLNFETKTMLLPNIAKLCRGLTWKIKSSDDLEFKFNVELGLIPN